MKKECDNCLFFPCPDSREFSKKDSNCIYYEQKLTYEKAIKECGHDLDKLLGIDSSDVKIIKE